ITGWTYGEKAVSPTAKAIFGNVIFTYSDSEKGAYTDAVPTDAGTWYVKAAVAGTDNYTALEATKEFTISQAANGWTEDLAMTGWTYGEKAVSPTAKAIFGDVIFTYSDSEKGVYTDTVPIDAGTWYVKAAVTGTDNYAGVETTRAFTITPKNIDNNSQIVIPYIKSDKDVENLVIKDGDKELKRGTDYDVNKKQDGSKVTVTITFKGNYTGTVTRTYTVENKKPSDNTDTQKASDTTKNDKNSAVQTGDTTTTGLWAMLMALSAGTAALLKSRKRKKETEE
ncbi:LPXTG cell wall anchor domain-containing protein, partial [Murimonas intestini]